ncbi:hypothetical protein NDU88_005875 [Pleurodeles waltl]|uniref:Uncharacterized protein n=1 Tax=Pleurodeles waltl TaxID=8319 RepID=A0AAV7RPN5_PLEWA|nr:hypothetical protein NDU88_005875 [Pleurodeles waltl]
MSGAIPHHGEAKRKRTNRGPPLFAMEYVGTTSMVEHMHLDKSEKFTELIQAMQNLKTSLELQLEALMINVGLLREDHKKLK